MVRLGDNFRQTTPLEGCNKRHGAQKGFGMVRFMPPGRNLRQ
jgi:hypothetical protein